MCSVQRPLDDKTQQRIALEAEAVLGILAICEAGQAFHRIYWNMRLREILIRCGSRTPRKR